MDGVSRYREHLNTTLRIQIEHSHLAHHRKSNGSEKKSIFIYIQGPLIDFFDCTCTIAHKNSQG